MIYASIDIIKNEKYPNWIRCHPIFKDINSYVKIFPQKGLKNDKVPLNEFLGGNYAIKFIKEIIEYKTFLFIENKNSFPELLKSDTKSAIYNFFQKFNYPEYIEIKKDKKIALLLTEDIPSNSGKIVFKKGSSLFSIIERAYELKLLPCDFFSFDSFKDFSRLNIPISSAEICFSTDPWDIATMSMRGIATCQSWTSDYRQCLIGSMLDPYVGIIYLASKNKGTDYGSKMLFRSIVRFAIRSKKDTHIYGDFEKSKPVLIIDWVYPQLFREVLEIFSKYLSSKSGLEVLFAPDIENEIKDGYYFLPKNNIKDTFKYYSEDNKHDKPLPDLTDSIESYQNIIIKTAPNNKRLDIKKQKEIIKKDFINTIINNISISNIQLSEFSSDKVNILLALKNKNFSFKENIIVSVRTFSNALMRDLNIDDNLDERSFRIKLYLSYFNKKNRIIDSISNQVVQWNGRLSLRRNSALTNRDFVLIMRQVMQKADRALKVELKSFLSGKPVDK